MKSLLLIVHCCCGTMLFAQTLQLHYDLQHSTVPSGSTSNHPTLYFEYFKQQDSGKSFIKPGAFLFKMQADFTGEKTNLGKFYVQVSQTLRCWRPKIFLHLQYSAGAGLTEPRQYSYYIRHTFASGVSIPFRWGNAWLAAVADYRLVAYDRPSHDAMLTLYWWKGLFHYKAEFAGDFSLWTENNNQGDDITKNLTGKKILFFAEPQCWFNLFPKLSIGSRLSMNYHVLSGANKLQCYPSVALRCKLN